MYDHDDPPPKWGSRDYYWAMANRWAEEAMRLLRFLGALIVGLWVYSADARWKPEYSNLTQAERDWYSSRQTTPDTRKRINRSWYLSCCDHADTVQADYAKDGSGWRYRIKGEVVWHTMPQDIVQLDIPTPHDQPVLFIDSTSANLGPICFFPGVSGV